MKRIGIDARLYFQTGVGTYLRNLLNCLQKIAPDNLEFYIYLLEKDAGKVNFNKTNFLKRPVTSSWHTFSEQTRFLYDIYKDNINLMHFTYFGYPILYRRRFISTVHDTTPLFFKTGKASTKNPLTYEIKHKVFKTILKTQINNAVKIITPTKTVKKQLVQIYGHSIGEKIIPIHEGVDRVLQKSDENTDLKKIFRQPFFIYVGNFYPHKNVEMLIKTFARVNSEYKLILIGPNDYFTNRLTQFINELSQQKRILFYHNATASDLKYLYSHAQALIHPSLSEGFGLPLLEATYCHCPVIGSSIEVFKELLNEEYLAFDPYNENDLIQKIEQSIVKKPVFDYQHIISQYSFEQMAKEILSIYIDCLPRN